MRKRGRRDAAIRHLVFVSILSAGLLLGAGCSSLPKETEPQGKLAEKGSKYLETGNSLFRQARFGEALDMYDLALESYIKIDDIQGIARSYIAAGSVYHMLGGDEQAERLLLRALAVVTPPGESEERSRFPGAAAEALGGLAEVAYMRGELEQALEYIERGMRLIDSGEFSREKAVLLHNRGTVRRAQGELPAAEEDLRRALELNRKSRRYGEMASNHYMLAAAAQKRKKPEEARDHLLRALELDRRTEHSIGIAYDLRALSGIAGELGDEEQEKEYRRRAERLFQSLGLDYAPESRPEHTNDGSRIPAGELNQ